jgi:hypothetical protein
MIARFFDWCGRNIEAIIWFNILLLAASATQQLAKGDFYPMGLCVVLIALMAILRK